MIMVHPEGYIFATLIGLSLGLIGGGGSVLTVPVLVYIMGISPVLSTSYSLFIVGVTALIGTLQYATNKLVDYKTGLLFGIPSIVAVYCTRRFLLPILPDPIMSIGDFILNKQVFIMGLFALLMILASISMILPTKEKDTNKHLSGSWFYISVIVEGVIVGGLTGLVGAGGGFLIIPALVIFAGLPMKLAVGTSLMIIALKSLIGFTGDLGHYTLNWNLLILFSVFAAIGMFLGTYLSKKISGAKLKPAFGWFVLIMGVFILINEFFINHN